MKAKARVLVVDDHPFMREGIRAYLNNQSDFEVVGQACDGEDGIAQAGLLQADLIVMDVSLPGMDGFEATRRLSRAMPHIKVLVLMPQHRNDLMLRARAAGALGCLAKDSPPHDLLQALQTLVTGKAFYPAAFLNLQHLASGQNPRDQLTAREIQVLTLLGDGYSNRAIAERLGISVRTVEKHRENILQALGLHNVADLVRFAVAEGFVRAERPPAQAVA